jgi:membrane protein
MPAPAPAKVTLFSLPGRAWRFVVDVAQFLAFLARRFDQDRCFQVAGSLTYSTLLAIVPLLMVVIAVLSQLPVVPLRAALEGLESFIATYFMPDIATRIMTVYFNQFAENAAKLTLLSVVILTITALSMLSTVDRALNAIWRVTQHRRLWVSLVAYVAVLLAVPVLVGISVSVTSYTVGARMFARVLPQFPMLLEWLPFAVSATAFTLLYKLIPNRRVGWGAAIVGGVIAGVLFEFGKELFALYVRLIPTWGMVYGTFATIPLFMLWVYLSWLLILFGAEITAGLAFWRDGLFRRPPTPAVRFRDTLGVTRALMSAEQPGQGLTFGELRARESIPDHEIEDALIRLLECGLVARVGKDRYRLAKRPEEVTLAEIYRLAFLEGSGLNEQDWAAISPELTEVAAMIDLALERPLASVLPAPPPPEKNSGGG